VKILKKQITPKILKASDAFIKFELLEIELENLKNLLDENKPVEVKIVLEKIIKLFKSNSEIVDHIYVEQNTIQ
jgi:intracellular sulfur oxidation DsrE/DsrF family protein